MVFTGDRQESFFVPMRNQASNLLISGFDALPPHVGGSQTYTQPQN